MTRSTTLKIGTVLLIALMGGCASEEKIKTTLKEHPEYIFDAMESKPELAVEAIQRLETKARAAAEAKQEAAMKSKMEDEFKHPKEAAIPEDRAVRGSKDAPITIVEYSDFQCPYCRQGFLTVEQLRGKYGDKMRFMFKHLPLPFHPMAMPAAKRFEAIAMQSADKAYRFHDMVFREQDKLKQEGEKFLDSVAKKAGANVAKMKSDMESQAVSARIDADRAEAAKFGFEGTPGFLVNGVSLAGAYPISMFEPIIERRLKESQKPATN